MVEAQKQLYAPISRAVEARASRAVEAREP
jgi:hypothetical protein